MCLIKYGPKNTESARAWLSASAMSKRARVRQVPPWSAPLTLTNNLGKGYHRKLLPYAHRCLYSATIGLYFCMSSQQGRRM